MGFSTVGDLGAMLRRRRLLGGIGAGLMAGVDPVEACPRDQIQHSWLGNLLFPDAYAACGGETLSIDTILQQQNLVAFQVSGSIGNMTVAPSLEYRDNNTGAWLPLPAGSSVTATRFSFSHPGLAAGTSPAPPPPPPPPPTVGTPGAPVVSSPSQGSGSIAVAYAVPTTGGTLNAGVFQVQYKLSSSGTYLNATVARYTTLNSPSFTDAFGNVWTVVPSIPSGEVNALMSNGNYTGAWNLGMAVLVGNNIYHVNIGGTWFVFSLSGPVNGAIGWTSIGTTSPLVAPGIVIGGLASGTYNVQGFATNTAGQGPNSAVINVPVSATAPPPPAPPPPPPGGGGPALVGIDDSTNIATVRSDLAGVATIKNCGLFFFDTDAGSGWNATTAANFTRAGGNGGRNLIDFAQSYGGPGVVIPMVGLQMVASNGGAVEDPNTAYAAIANGSHDAWYNAVFAGFATAGYHTLYIRPAWEYNGGWFPHVVNSGNVSNFIAAFRHIYTIAHARTDITVKVCWNPNCEGGFVIRAFSSDPGAGFMDMIGIDSSGPGTGGPSAGDPNDSSAFTVYTAGRLAVQRGIPLCVPEWGNNEGTWNQETTTIGNALNSIPGLAFDHFQFTNGVSGWSWENNSSDVAAIRGLIPRFPARTASFPNP